jgi:hypothetical protein
MRTHEHKAFAVLDRYDTFYGGHQSDAGVGTGRRRRCLDLYGFRFFMMLGNVFVIEMRDSVVFSVVETVLEFERIG